MKPVVFVAMFLFGQFAFATPGSSITKEHYLQVLYSELKFVESETFRVEFTIETLEDRLHEGPIPEQPEDLFLQLESLYRYSTRLDAYHRELNEVWNQLLGADDGASVAFTHDQLKPITIISKGYMDGVPEDAIPVSELLLNTY